MSELYRKRGRVMRYENGVVVHVSEAGEAIERGVAFECRPALECGGVSHRFEGGGFAAALQGAARLPNVERLIITEGYAEHEYGDVRWTETTRRIHVSIAAHGVRALIDTADFDLALAERVANTIEKAREAKAPRPMRLAPNVTAALLPSLVGVIDIEQTLAAHDGKGQPIEQQIVSSEQPPNWYRPSYRIRPQRVWFHLQVRPFGAIDKDAPLAIALVGPRRVLLEDGRMVEIDLSAVAAVGEPDGWYPYGAGSFGAELML